MVRDSLTFRLVAAALAWMALVLGAGGVELTRAFRDTMEQALAERLDSHLRAIVAGIAVDDDGKVTIRKPAGEPRFEQPLSGWYWQVTDETGLMLRSRSLWDKDLPVLETGHGGQLEIHTGIGPAGAELLVVERDILLPDLDQPLHAVVATDMAEVEREIDRFGMLLLTSLSILALGLLVAVVVQVRFGLKPLRRMVAELDQIRSGARARLGEEQPAEIAPVALAMNAVLDHDAALIDRARTHVGNLAHGLKTPMAVLKAEIECGRHPDIKVLGEQIAALDRLVTHHLARASAEAGSARALESRLAIASVVQGLCDALAKIFAEKGLVIDTDIQGAPLFAGERQDFEEILGNLAENACKWARTRVRVGAKSENGRLLLVVEDDGPGMSDEEARQASRRGIRLDEATPGFGLGLSIVADLTQLHGGTLGFGRSTLGGLKAMVDLPQERSAIRRTDEVTPPRG